MEQFGYLLWKTYISNSFSGPPFRRGEGVSSAEFLMNASPVFEEGSKRRVVPSSLLEIRNSAVSLSLPHIASLYPGLSLFLTPM